MKKRIAVALSMFIIASLILAGCGGAKNSSEGQKAAGQEKVTIRFAHWRGEDLEAFNKIIQQFQKENPNIVVNQSVETSEQYRTKIQAELQGGEGPDIFATMPGSDFAALSSANAYVDLSGSSFLGNFNPELLKPGQINGKQYAIPYQLVYNIPVYNKDIFQKYNLEPPKDWQGFLALCQKLKDNGITPIILDSEIGFGQFINPMLMNNMPSGDTLSKVQKGEAKLTDPWFVTTLKQFKELNDKGYFQKDVLGTKKAGAAALFAQGKGAMLAQGSYMMATIKQQNPNIHQGLLAPITVPADQMKYEGIHTATFMLGINSKSKNIEAAKKFLEYLFRPDIASQYANATGQLLTVNNVKYDSPELTEQSKWLSKKTLFQPRYMITVREVETAVTNAIADVLSGMSPEDAAAKAQKAVDMVVKKQ
ncbi:Multiple sugar-binding protein [Neomoorella glycerini]|uniref:Multiple sugar-binding protein n=1 Tax=Neomoorella glycerini TaxID=55779 RepID=A0A6I5ZN63_9FIRM|nr:extracellular solute-binding protein [Moorella glycerini]QGP91051.1 Multiple sugar-binding protein [Moorella glycerini]